MKGLVLPGQIVHGEAFALSGVDFAGHDTAARLILHKFILPRLHGGAQEADVIYNLEQGQPQLC